MDKVQLKQIIRHQISHKELTLTQHINCIRYAHKLLILKKSCKTWLII